MVQFATPARRVVYAARNRLTIRGMPEKEQSTPVPTPHAQYALGILIDAVARTYHRAEILGHVLEVAERADLDGDHRHADALRDTVERIRAAGQCVAPVASNGALVELARKVAEAYPRCGEQVVQELREDAVKGTTTELVARVVAADALQWAMDARRAVKV